MWGAVIFITPDLRSEKQFSDINDEISCNLLTGEPNWDGNNCFYIIEMNEVFCLETIDGSWQNNECYIVCTSNEASCNSLEGTWNGNECMDYPQMK